MGGGVEEREEGKLSKGGIILYNVEGGQGSWRNKLNGAAHGGEYDLLLWWGSVVYITSRKGLYGLVLG